MYKRISKNVSAGQDLEEQLLGRKQSHPEVAAFKSKREARQRIEGGAVKLDGEAVTDPNAGLNLAGASGAELRLQAGKKRRFRVRLRGS